MKYKKEILIAGAHALRRRKVAALNEEQRKNFEEEERILQQYADDQPLIEERANKLMLIAQDGEPITAESLKTIFQVTQRDWPKVRTLGLDKERLDLVRKRIEDKEAEIISLEEEPLHIVEFLEAIEDDMVSDYGLKQAGFSVRTAELITLGLEELRAEKSAERQAAEAAG
ncbi:hypothetical protein SEA_WOLLYPOG_60 [Arthrobacter phage Wollypog]|uniref:Uncharacterized protein n=1 Tax=Arthrobacter phage Wollypog TaxID=2790985 RepID=A0A7T3N1F7_9CAUD|nr:hypothetical protein PP291_gp60 [Arthrobacter phage Wollypog]QPX62612.1 hypothetical protein SEA_WOLLYPOG_60 [Arthrobacter phage Wollypog]